MDDDKVFPHLGPYYIKRFVEDNSKYKVDIIDNSNDLYSYDVIGVSATTPQYLSMDKSLLPKNRITVMGGPHCFHHNINGFTHVVTSDGCSDFLDILNGISPRGIPDNKNQLPHRDKSFHKYKYYLDNKTVTTMITSRGCPNKCFFCEAAGNKVRFKDSVYVQKEIAECVDLGFEAIMFFDDLFCISYKRVKELCDIIKPFNIKFRCFAQAKIFNEPIAEALANAGCVEIGYGAESLDQNILDIVNKKTTVSDNYRIIEIAHKYNIRVKSFLMIGLPGENKESILNMEQFLESSNVDDFDISIYYPYEGTYIYDNIQLFDLKIHNDIETIGFYKGQNGSAECKVSTSALNPEELLAYKNNLFNKYKNRK